MISLLPTSPSLPIYPSATGQCSHAGDNSTASTSTCDSNDRHDSPRKKSVPSKYSQYTWSSKHGRHHWGRLCICHWDRQNPEKAKGTIIEWPFYRPSMMGRPQEFHYSTAVVGQTFRNCAIRQKLCDSGRHADEDEPEAIATAQSQPNFSRANNLSITSIYFHNTPFQTSAQTAYRWAQHVYDHRRHGEHPMLPTSLPPRVRRLTLLITHLHQ